MLLGPYGKHLGGSALKRADGFTRYLVIEYEVLERWHSEFFVRLMKNSLFY